MDTWGEYVPAPQLPLPLPPTPIGATITAPALAAPQSHLSAALHFPVLPPTPAYAEEQLAMQTMTAEFEVAQWQDDSQPQMNLSRSCTHLLHCGEITDQGREARGYK